MTPEKRDDFLAQEYLLLQKTIEDYDGRALTIKAWSVTFSAAALGLAYINGKAVILLLASLGSLIFWILETLWKTHQRAYYKRIERIERHFADGGEPPLAPFQAFRYWEESFWGAGMIKRWFGRMLLLNAALPHVIVLAAGILLYLFYPPPMPPAPIPIPPPSATPR